MNEQPVFIIAPQERTMNITTIGLDLAKSIFYLVCLNQAHRVCSRKKLRRAQMLSYFSQLAPCVVAMEACAGAHYWARQLKQYGHTVRLLPAQHVKPFLQGSKNDYNDALAIAEAAQRPQLHFVPAKTVKQQDLQSLQRLRESAIAQRTALCNQIRGLLAEYGIIVAKGVAQLSRAIPDILEDADNGLTDSFRAWLNQLQTQLQQLNEHISYYDKDLKQHAQQDEQVQRLMTIPGFGPVVAVTFLTAISDANAFRQGRDVSAFLGLVPKQHSSGGKAVLLGITKRGNKHARAMLIQGMQSVILHAHKKSDALSRWVTELIQRRGRNKAVVALANKLARVAWALLKHQQNYQLKTA